MELHSIGLNTKSVSRTKGGAEVKTKQRQEEVKDVLEEFIDYYDDRYEPGPGSWFEKCPRCGEKSKNLAGHPYCLHCNWDSLTDLTYQKGIC